VERYDPVKITREKILAMKIMGESEIAQVVSGIRTR
jgi:hypothetical protein